MSVSGWNSVNIRHPVGILAASLILFILCDNLIFRSGLYLRIVLPTSVGGDLAYLIQSERARGASGKEEVLLTGDSKMEQGFSPKLFKLNEPQSNISFIQGAIPGTTLKSWYYTLRLIDPNHNRYAAIVLPIPGYKVTSVWGYFENRVDTGQILAPFLDSSQWADLISTYTDQTARFQVASFAVLQSHAMAPDVRDLFTHLHRRVLALLRFRAGHTTPSDDPPHEQSIDDLLYDRTSGTIVAYPSHFNAFMRKESKREFATPSASEAKFAAEYDFLCTTNWVKRIAALYAGSRTKLVLINIPHVPIAVPSHIPIDGARDIREAIPKQDNIVVVDPAEFQLLETPAYFFDVQHLNGAGRRKFTDMLGRRMERVLGKEGADGGGS